tara:strand:+ start:26026 stop:26979 length:954 start_codon:yes stop_codon:yes gene_type:complete
MERPIQPNEVRFIVETAEFTIEKNVAKYLAFPQESSAEDTAKEPIAITTVTSHHFAFILRYLKYMAAGNNGTTPLTEFELNYFAECSAEYLDEISNAANTLNIGGMVARIALYKQPENIQIEDAYADMSQYDDFVIVVSSNGKKFKVPVELARASDTLRDVIGSAVVTEIPTQVPTDHLRAIFPYLPWLLSEEGIKATAARKLQVDKYAEDKEKFKDDKNKLEKLWLNTPLVAGFETKYWEGIANRGEHQYMYLEEISSSIDYLAIITMFYGVCRAIANLVKGKTPDDIRINYNLPKPVEVDDDDAAAIDAAANAAE